MRLPEFLHPLIYSFYSAPFYRRVASVWQGYGSRYLLFLILLFNAIDAVDFQFWLLEFVNEKSLPILSQIPEISIKSGIVAIGAEMPYEIVDPATGKVIIILDTTGQVTSLMGSEAHVLLTRTDLLTRNSAGEVGTTHLAFIPAIRLDRERVMSWLRMLKRFLTLFLYVLAVAFYSISYGLLTLLIAVVGLIYVEIMHWDLSYRVTVRLTAVAMTPPILLDAVSEIPGSPLSTWFPWYAFALLSLAYSLFAVWTNRDYEG